MAPRVQRSLRWWLTASFRALLAPVAVLLAIIAVSLVVQLGWLAPRLSTAIEGAAVVQRAHDGMLNQETGVRGYLLVPTPSARAFLEPYESGLSAASAGFAGAGTVLADDPVLVPLLDATRQRAQRWQEQWARPAVLERSDAWADSDRTAFLARGKALFDDYRAAYGELVAALDRRTQQTMTAERTSVLTGLVAALAAALGLLASLRRQRQRLSRAIVDPTVRLAAAVSRHTEGGLDPDDPDLVGDRDPARTPLELSGLREEVRTLVEVLSRREAQLRAQVDRSGRLLELTRRLTGSLDRDAIAVTALDATLALSGLHDGTVWLAEPDPDRPARDRYRLHAQRSATVCELRSLLQVDGSVAGRAIGLGRVVDELAVTAMAAGPPDAIPRLAVPFISAGRTVGLVELRRAGDVVLPPDLIAGLEVLATAAATALEVAELHAQTRELTVRDPLTRLYNRRRLTEDLDLALHLAGRAKQPFALVMIDIDHFKQLNDTLGHQTGDQVLRDVADAIAATLRGGDTAYRYGGEEFLVLARNTSREGGHDLAERVRTQVAAQTTPQVTVSCGVAGMLADAATAADLLVAADQALYAAKHAGRNRTATAPDNTASSTPSHGRSPSELGGLGG